MATSSSLYHRILCPTLLCLVFFVITTTTTTGLTVQSDDSASDSDSARLAAPSLAHLLRRRSAELQAPPHYYASRLAGFLSSAPTKRDDGYWIWMPAHGYMSVPRDEVSSSSGDKDSMGNLLRYGRK